MWNNLHFVLEVVTSLIKWFKAAKSQANDPFKICYDPSVEKRCKKSFFVEQSLMKFDANFIFRKEKKNGSFFALTIHE